MLDRVAVLENIV